MNSKTALIIGAGPAGLTAAYELLTRTDIKPIIIESESQVGGISRTINYKGNRIDIGGHRFFSKSEEVLKWWFKFMPLDPAFSSDQLQMTYQNQTATFATGKTSSNKNPETTSGTDRESTDRLRYMMVRPRKSRIYYNKQFFGYPLQLTFDTMRKLGMVKLFKIGVSYFNSKLFPEKPEKHLASFFRNRFGNELYRTFFKDYTEKVWGIPCENIPADWGRQRVKDLNVSKVLLHSFKNIFRKNNDIYQQKTSTSLIEQFLYPPFGPGQMWETVADKVRSLGGKIHLSSSVVGLHADQPGNIESVTIASNSGEKEIIKADYFFSTMPVKNLVSSITGIDIPAPVKEIAEGLKYRDFLIVGLLATTTAPDKSGDHVLTDNWIYIQDKKVKAGRLQLFHNWSPYMVADPGKAWLGVEYFCNENEAFWNQTDKEIIDQAINEMHSIGLIAKNTIEDAVVIKVKKAYPSYHGTYNRFAELRNFLDTFSNLFELGRNGMHRYNNSDHSMLTAMRAVDNIISGEKDRSGIWNINTEENYHEE